jgi:glycosyltransferase involved in cell wall biosynthesis
MKITLVIPAHNEEAVLEKNIRETLNFLFPNFDQKDWQIIIAENGSRDKTSEIARRLCGQEKNLSTFSLSQASKWLAIKKGWNSFPADYLIFMDADLATDLKHLPELIEKLKENDLVIGTRYHKNSQTKRTLKRNLLSIVYNHLARLILSLPFSDFQCGFKGLRHETWLKIKPLILSNQMSFDTEIIALTKHFGYKIAELPVCWAEKNCEQRKSSVRIFKTGQDLIKNLLRLRRRLAHLPKI